MRIVRASYPAPVSERPEVQFGETYWGRGPSSASPGSDIPGTPHEGILIVVGCAGCRGRVPASVDVAWLDG